MVSPRPQSSLKGPVSFGLESDFSRVRRLTAHRYTAHRLRTLATLAVLPLALVPMGCSSNAGGNGGFVRQSPDVRTNFGGWTTDVVVSKGDVSADVAIGDDGKQSADLDAEKTVDAGQTVPEADVNSATTTDVDGGAGSTLDAQSDSEPGGAADTAIAPCGDKICAATESCLTCAADCGFCPKSCGDKTCNADETCKNCPGDCGQCAVGCGDGTCNAATEDCKSCSLDCGKCPALCGDSSCNGSESCSTCPIDCGACAGTCGDGKCDATKEDCKTCSADCGNCPGACDPLGSKGCGATQQCYPTSNGPLCGTPGSKPINTACKLMTDCSKGLLCVGKVCQNLCDSSGANATFKCAQGKCDALQYSDGKPVGYKMGTCVVYNKCNLTTDVGCLAAQSCVNAPSGKVCVAVGTQKIGTTCGGTNSCVKGAMCIGNPAVCLQKCRTTGGSPSCLGGKKCLVVTSSANAKPLPDSVGVCN